jgi:hypothetical protein
MILVNVQKYFSTLLEINNKFYYYMYGTQILKCTCKLQTYKRPIKIRIIFINEKNKNNKLCSGTEAFIIYT